MEEFRKAKCIEFHDSNLALTTSSETYGNTCLTGRTEYPEKPAFRLNLGDIGMLATAIGSEVKENIKVPFDSKQTIATPSEVNKTEDVELPIFKAYFDYTNSIPEEEIKTIECSIISEKLINIKITSKLDGDEEEKHEEITYSGSFTVYWE